MVQNVAFHNQIDVIWFFIWSGAHKVIDKMGSFSVFQSMIILTLFYLVELS